MLRARRTPRRGAAARARTMPAIREIAHSSAVRNAAASASGTAVRLLVAPALVLDGCRRRARVSDSTTRCGMPMSSMSANSTPGRSSRSSSNTSMPAAASVRVQPVGGLAHCRRSCGSRCGTMPRLERRHRRGQDDAALVVVLLDRRGDDARHADAVAAHLERLGCLPSSSRKVAFIASEYFVRSWKMWPTSMPRAISSLPLPSGLGSPATTLRMSATCGLGQVAAPVHAGEVEALLVGAADEVAHRRHGAVGDDSDRRDRSRPGPM